MESKLSPFEHQFMGEAFETLIRESCLRPIGGVLGFEDLNRFRQFESSFIEGAVEVDGLFRTKRRWNSFELIKAIEKAIQSKMEPALQKTGVSSRNWNQQANTIQEGSLIIIEVKKTFGPQAQEQILDFARYERLKKHLEATGLSSSSIIVIPIHNGKKQLLTDLNKIKLDNKLAIQKNVQDYPSIGIIGDVFASMNFLYKSILKIDLGASSLINAYVDRLMDIRTLEAKLEDARKKLNEARNSGFLV